MTSCKDWYFYGNLQVSHTEILRCGFIYLFTFAYLALGVLEITITLVSTQLLILLATSGTFLQDHQKKDDQRLASFL